MADNDTTTQEQSTGAQGADNGASGADGGQGVNPQNEQGSKYNPADLDEARKIIAALEKRVGERDATIGNINERLSAIESARRSQLEQAGNYQELLKETTSELESVKPLAERAEQLEAMIRESNKKRVEQIPEAMRGLVPADYAPEKLSAWLDANLATLRKPPVPSSDIGAGSGGSGGIEITDNDRRLAEIARNSGMTNITPEAIAKRRQQQDN